MKIIFKLSRLKIVRLHNTDNDGINVLIKNRSKHLLSRYRYFVSSTLPGTSFERREMNPISTYYAVKFQKNVNMTGSVVDPHQFDADPDPWIRAGKKSMRIWIFGSGSI